MGEEGFLSLNLPHTSGNWEISPVESYRAKNSHRINIINTLNKLPMSQRTTPFGKSYTIPQFKEERKFNKTFFNFVRNPETKEPVFFKNADKTPTTIQKITVRDEAGNIQAYCSKEVAADIAAGKDIKNQAQPLKYLEVFYDHADPKTGELIEDDMRVVMTYNKSNLVAESLVADFD